MNFKPVIALVLFLVIIFFVLLACGTDEATPEPVEEPVSAASPPEAAAPETPKDITAKTLVNLNLRQGPGTDYPVTGS